MSQIFGSREDSKRDRIWGVSCQLFILIGTHVKVKSVKDINQYNELYSLPFQEDVWYINSEFSDIISFADWVRNVKFTKIR